MEIQKIIEEVKSKFQDAKVEKIENENLTSDAYQVIATIDGEEDAIGAWQKNQNAAWISAYLLHINPTSDIPKKELQKVFPKITSKKEKNGWKIDAGTKAIINQNPAEESQEKAYIKAYEKYNEPDDKY